MRNRVRSSCTQLGLHFDRRLRGWETLEHRAVEADRLVAVWRWKSALGPEFPVILSLFGGTGTGKSTLFNSLAGEIVSRVSWLRPCTAQPVIYVHNKAVEELSECPLVVDLCTHEERDLAARVVGHHREEMAGILLVDTPDIDSVELANREIAEEFFTISDIVMFVTSLDKYGDHSGKVFRDKIRDWGKRSIFVMNKAHVGDAFEDFQRGLAIEGFQSEGLVLVEDTGMSPEMVPGLAERTEIAEIFAAAQDDVRPSELHNLSVVTVRRVEDLEQAINEQLSRIVGVNDQVRQAFDRGAEEMDERLNAVISPEVANRVQERLSVLLQKYDILFPVRMFVRDIAKKSLGFVWKLITSEQPERAAESGERAVFAQDLAETKAVANLAPLEYAVARINQEIAEILKDDPNLEDLSLIALHDVPRMSSGEIKSQFDSAFPGVEHLLEEEFARFRQGGLSATHEATLYGAYAFWAFLLITAEVVMIGGSTWIDALLGPMIAPFIPKWLLGMKVRDILREIGERINNEYRGILRGILERQAMLYSEEFRRLLPDDQDLARLADLRGHLTHEIAAHAGSGLDQAPHT